MGAGKSTLGAEIARLLGRPFVDLDEEIERETGRTIAELFEEGSFRQIEAAVADDVLARGPSVVALGGGAVETAAVRERLKEAFVLHVEGEVGAMWERARSSERPLAREESRFRALFAERAPLYEQVADARISDARDGVLAAAAVHVGSGAVERLAELVPGVSPASLVSEPIVGAIHGATARLALGGRLEEAHELPSGEAAKQPAAVERLWRALRLPRGGTIVALGGGSLTDAAGFAAATYLRGIDWVAVPTTLVGQVDAAIGGKTAIDVPEGKNLVGAFHWPVATVVDPALLATLPEPERANGLAEVVKTGLLAGAPLWELDDPELVRRCAAYKAALCLRDPYDRGPRRTLNLGHTFAHALEAASGYTLAHGHAVALGLEAALALSGRDASPVEAVLSPERARVDPELAWSALLRDKKGPLRIVLLGDEGGYEEVLSAPDVRRALDTLIA